MENKLQKNYALPVSIVIAALIISSAWVFTAPERAQNAANKNVPAQKDAVAVTVPSEGVTLPVVWGDLGAKMASVGVIDAKQFEALYANRGGDAQEMKRLLYGDNNGNIKITKENSGMILNFLWALGLGTKNDILERGPMMDKRYNGAGSFASTGGWTIAAGPPMDHYSRHPFVVLTPEQQKIVESAAKNIYRPCCGNSTHFPDCNHGMAMLGLLELAASQGADENELYRMAFQVNTYWFPDAYRTIADYFQLKNTPWVDADPKEILGLQYSSASGFA